MANCKECGSFITDLKPIEEIEDAEEAKEYIVACLRTRKSKHATPDNLVNTYSGMGGHPIRYCGYCCKLIDKFQIEDIPGVKKGMWTAYYEEEK